MGPPTRLDLRGRGPAKLLPPGPQPNAGPSTKQREGAMTFAFKRPSWFNAGRRRPSRPAPWLVGGRRRRAPPSFDPEKPVIFKLPDQIEWQGPPAAKTAARCWAGDPTKPRPLCVVINKWPRRAINFPMPPRISIPNDRFITVLQRGTWWGRAPANQVRSRQTRFADAGRHLRDPFSASRCIGDGRQGRGRDPCLIVGAKGTRPPINAGRGGEIATLWARRRTQRSSSRAPGFGGHRKPPRRSAKAAPWR